MAREETAHAVAELLRAARVDVGRCAKGDALAKAASIELVIESFDELQRAWRGLRDPVHDFVDSLGKFHGRQHPAHEANVERFPGIGGFANMVKVNRWHNSNGNSASTANNAVRTGRWYHVVMTTDASTTNIG